MSTVAVRAPSRLELRRERFIEQAERLFLQKGYAGASVNEIVRLAGGSLATLYSEFGSKEGLFAAIMSRRARALFDWHVSHSPRRSSLRSALVVLATRLLNRILSEDSLAFYRVFISEGPRFAELRAAILDVGMPAYFDSVGTALVEIGAVERRDCATVAEEFVTLVYGQHVFRAACSDGSVIPDKLRTRHIEQAVDAFLALHPIVQPSRTRTRIAGDNQ